MNDRGYLDGGCGELPVQVAALYLGFASLGIGAFVSWA
jgi:hypothetical protein